MQSKLSGELCVNNYNENFLMDPISPLPERLIVGYANWNQCDESLVKAASEGVNVLIWFSINLSTDLETGLPMITNGPNMDCVAQLVKTMADMRLTVKHLISIGGWNSPHPDTLNTPEVVYEHWNHWNRVVIARPDIGFNGFDGFDWDIEGNDDPSSIYNTFTVECLDLMGRFSQLAKSQGNYIVAMAPAESYLDPRTNLFDRSLLHTYPEWSHLQPPFAYHGMNCYAYLLSRYGNSCAMKTGEAIETFDFVTVQLYEGYSHAQYDIFLAKKSPAECFKSLIIGLSEGWDVDFSSDSALGWDTQKVSVPLSKIVIGIANGWAGDGKFLLLYPDQLKEAYENLRGDNICPRGFAFWNILDEGRVSNLNPEVPVFMAAGLNQFLHTREGNYL